jgi:two-component system chemotaxis response regulator CheB
MAKTRVLIVDDSAVMRQLLTEILSHDPELEVVGAASDPIVARDKIKALNPDVLTLDVEMPRMDGLSFLEKLMRARPMPVLMVSSLTEQGAATTLRAMELGAVDFVTKPKIDVRTGTLDLADEIVQKVKSAARARPRALSPHAAAPTRGHAHAAPHAGALLKSTHKVIAVGASTGGTEALREFLVPLPSDTPGIVIVQHMPASFTRSFADRLDQQCQMRVKEAEDGDRILPGHVLIAPGDFQMRVHRSGAVYNVRITQDEPVNRHRPSVDVLFDSCAQSLGANAVGVILTGMGADGARGMAAMRKAGARTLAQDEATCVVFGMPREAILAGGVEQTLPLQDLPNATLRAVAEDSR